MESDYSNSQCSCNGDGSCTCSFSDSEEETDFRIPVPQLVEADVEIVPAQKPSPANSEEMKYSSTTEADQHYRDCAVYAFNNGADSATDSAIDMPHGDSSVSTLNDAAVNGAISPPYSRPLPSLPPQANTGPLSTECKLGLNSTADDEYATVNKVLVGSNSSDSDPLLVPNDSSREDNSATEADMHTSLIPKYDFGSLYSHRPDPGPMRTFCPKLINGQTGGRQH